MLKGIEDLKYGDRVKLIDYLGSNWCKDMSYLKGKTVRFDHFEGGDFFRAIDERWLFRKEDIVEIIKEGKKKKMKCKYKVGDKVKFRSDLEVGQVYKDKRTGSWVVFGIQQ